jgi:hypothetical protein
MGVNCELSHECFGTIINNKIIFSVNFLTLMNLKCVLNQLGKSPLKEIRCFLLSKHNSLVK